tara:strand:+ start:194 stop:415 length:222 start_codon:yes stop_codon:yes gene_type:complete
MPDKQSWRRKIKNRISGGFYEEYKGLSICKINDFYPLMSGKVKYQVHSYFYSNLFDDIEEALDKFFEIRRKIK